MKSVKKILVIGATGGSGRSTVTSLRNRGYQVTALSRNASKSFSPPIRTVDGSAMDRDTLTKAIEGQDAVIITLGISENPFRVRLWGPQRTPINIRSAGTQQVIEVMESVGVKRLIVQTTFGSGPSKHLLRTLDRLFFDWVLKPQIDDTELQDSVVRKTTLDWTIVQPVHLSDDEDDAIDSLKYSANYDVGNWSVPRKLVGEYMGSIVDDPGTFNQTITLSQQ